MKDIERLILKSFVFAVAQQQHIPKDLQQQLQRIISALPAHIAELDGIARASTNLKPAYQWAYKALTTSAAERGLGADFPPAPYDEDGPAYELDNIVPAPERHKKELLNAIEQQNSDVHIDAISQALSSENPSQTIKKIINP